MESGMEMTAWGCAWSLQCGYPTRRMHHGFPSLLTGLIALTVAGCRLPAPEEMSFLVISMDTVRADHIGARDASGHPLAPSLDAFAAESVVYSRAFAQSNETLFSHTALFTGRNPSHWGDLSYFSYRLPADAPTFSTILYMVLARITLSSSASLLVLPPALTSSTSS